jgi:hypothetical protein
MGSLRRELEHVPDRARAALLGKAEQRHEGLGRRLGVGQRAVAGLDGGAEEVGERAEADAGRAAGEEASCKPDRVEHRGRQPSPFEGFDLAVEEADVEAGIVGDEHALAGEREKTAHGLRGGRSTAEVTLSNAGQGGDRTRERASGIDQGLEPTGLCEIDDADGADLADAIASRCEARGLEVEDDVCRGLERKLVELRAGKTDRAAPPGKPRVLRDDLFEEPARERLGRSDEREEARGSVLGGYQSMALLEELDQPVGGVQPELHGAALYEHTFYKSSSAGPVDAGEAAGEQPNKERRREADDVQVVALDALDEGGARALDRVSAGPSLPLTR